MYRIQSLRQQLETRREELNLTPNEVATEARIPRATLYKKARGERGLKPAEALRLAKVLKLDPQYAATVYFRDAAKADVDLRGQLGWLEEELGFMNPYTARFSGERLALRALRKECGCEGDAFFADLADLLLKRKLFNNPPASQRERAARVKNEVLEFEDAAQSGLRPSDEMLNVWLGAMRNARNGRPLTMKDLSERASQLKGLHAASSTWTTETLPRSVTGIPKGATLEYSTTNTLSGGIRLERIVVTNPSTVPVKLVGRHDGYEIAILVEGRVRLKLHGRKVLCDQTFDAPDVVLFPSANTHLSLLLGKRVTIIVVNLKRSVPLGRLLGHLPDGLARRAETKRPKT